jgi:hypothetical protein
MWLAGHRGQGGGDFLQVGFDVGGVRDPGAWERRRREVMADAYPVRLGDGAGAIADAKVQLSREAKGPDPLRLPCHGLRRSLARLRRMSRSTYFMMPPCR